MIDPHWRAGILSIRAIADEYYVRTGERVSSSGIKKHYDELGINKDLTPRINARAQELVHSKTAISDDEIVDVNAEQQKVIILNERRDVARA